MSWNDLSMSQKAEVMRLAVGSGIYDLDTIRDGYNEFAKGGNLYDGESESTQQMDSSNSYYYQTTDTRDGVTYNVHPSAIGAKGLEVTVPETVVIAPRKQRYVSAFHPEDTLPFINVLTGNVLDRISPTQTGRALYDTFDPELSTKQKLDSWVLGNNGVVSDEYAREHPLLAAAYNFAGDAGVYGTASLLGKMPAWSAAMQAEQRAAQDAVAAEWQGLVGSGVRRTLLGDVEIDNPNLLYHLDRGNGMGAFNNQGAYVQDGLLFPGTPKDASATPYSWWNKGKPYATHVNGQPMTRLMTATEDVPGMLHVRSQNYPIGQWNGRRGFVLNSEYVNPEGINVAESTYTLDPNYGWRKMSVDDTPSIEWTKAQKVEPFRFTRYKESPFQMHLKRAKAKGYDTSNIKVIDLTKDSPERTEYINNSDLIGTFEEKLQKLIDRINKGGGAGNPKGTRYILHTNPDNLDARLSHELNHLLKIPDEPVPKGTVYGGWMNLYGNYFKRFNNTDIAARLSQVRDYYGQTGKEPLTEPMLKYAREHYESDTGLKNKVQEMLCNTGDLKGLAEWGTKYATGLLPFVFFSPYYFENE